MGWNGYRGVEVGFLMKTRKMMDLYIVRIGLIVCLVEKTHPFISTLPALWDSLKGDSPECMKPVAGGMEVLGEACLVCCGKDMGLLADGMDDVQRYT